LRGEEKERTRTDHKVFISQREGPYEDPLRKEGYELLHGA
jgi:hypothetical protein